jgi:hypothetical protein
MWLLYMWFEAYATCDDWWEMKTLNENGRKETSDRKYGPAAAIVECFPLFSPAFPFSIYTS